MVNCRHYPMVFIPNFSTLKGSPQGEEANDEAYALSQEQRVFERKVRAEKRDLEVLKAQGADEKAINAQKAKIDKANAELAEFCTDHEMPRRKNREGAPIRATWPDENGGKVERFNESYIPYSGGQ